MSTLILYGRSTSFNVQKVLWFLAELETPFEHIQYGGRHGGLDGESFSELNPMRKVPVLEKGRDVVWESHTILRYLAAVFGAGHWHPEDPYQRSLVERWMDWSQTHFQPVFMKTFWGFYRVPPAKRDMPEVMASMGECLKCINRLEHQLGDQAYLLGDQLTLADICTGAILYRLTTQGLKVELPPAVQGWYERLQQRPGYQRWVMSDYSELKGREVY